MIATKSLKQIDVTACLIHYLPIDIRSNMHGSRARDLEQDWYVLLAFRLLNLKVLNCKN
jgi:hypothetical protein